MADRPHVSRVCRPRSKSEHQTKAKEPPNKNPPKQNLTKATPSIGTKCGSSKALDQQEEEVQLHPLNQPDQLPSNPPKPAKPPSKSPKSTAKLSHRSTKLVSRPSSKST